jgi:hypothetical protein
MLNRDRIGGRASWLFVAIPTMMSIKISGIISIYYLESDRNLELAIIVYSTISSSPSAFARSNRRD